MSDTEYVMCELKRFLAVLYFKYTASELIPNEEAIRLADELLKDID